MSAAIFRLTGSFWLALLLAPVPIAVVGIVMEMAFLRPLYRRGHLDQVLLTFGLRLSSSMWCRRSGARTYCACRTRRASGRHLGARRVLDLPALSHRFGFVIALLLWLFLDRSRLGAIVRAGVDDSAMAGGLGGNIPALFTAIFGAGVALAALGGVAAGPIFGMYPGEDAEILIPAFIVIVVGGMGSLRGAFVGSLLIGEADTFGKAYVPSWRCS